LQIADLYFFVNKKGVVMEVDSKGKGYVVTGGAGFIGSHLCRKLVERGDRVFCVDNLSTGSLEHISGLFDNPRFTFIKGDVREVELEAIEADGCYHLAALCGVPRVEREPLNVILTVIEGRSVCFAGVRIRGYVCFTFPAQRFTAALTFIRSRRHTGAIQILWVHVPLTWRRNGQGRPFVVPIRLSEGFLWR
jgi:hypothetical protein